MIQWLYTRPGCAEDAEQIVPEYLSKRRLFTIAFIKANFAALRQLVVWTDTA